MAEGPGAGPLVGVVSIVTVCCVLAPATPVALAGGYHYFACRIPYGPEAGRPAAVAEEDFSYTTAGGPYLGAGNGCSEGGSLFAAMDGETSHAYEAGASVTFTAPAGLTISGFDLWRYEATVEGVAYGSPEAKLLYAPGPPAAQTPCVGNCARGTQSEPLSPANEVSSSGLGGVREVQWSARCGGGPGGTCPEYGARGSGALSAQYDVYAADIDLVDDTPPTVGEVGGPLVAGGALAGDESVSFQASDGQSGVYGGSLVVDGKTVVSQVLDGDEGHCKSLNLTGDGQRSFEYPQPCAPSLSASLTLDTSTLSPGAHSLQVIVEDAAGNQTVAYDGTIDVSGPPAAGGASGAGTGGPCAPGMLRGSAGGAGAGAGRALLSARWSGGAGSKAGRRSAAGAGSGESAAAAGSVAGAGTLTSRYGTVDRIAGRLTGPGGAGVADGTIDVCELPAYDGAQARLIERISSGPAGQWSLTLPRDVSSGALYFVYASPLDEAIPLATATLTLGVHAGIALQIAPRVVSVGRRIFFSGVVHGAPIPHGGKQLVLEASSGREWVQFDAIHTDAHGRFRASYRFKFPGPVSYRFRAVSPYEADFPFLAGVSNMVRVYEG